MKDWKPGRELDVAVHRVLWPDAEIVDKPGYEGVLVDNPSEVWKEWRAIPAYSTDIMAWDWSREGWYWGAQEYVMGVTAELSIEGLGYIIKEVGDYIPAGQYVPFKAQAFARCMCVLQWAEANHGD